jgi:hypothetical protein
VKDLSDVMFSVIRLRLILVCPGSFVKLVVFANVWRIDPNWRSIMSLLNEWVSSLYSICNVDTTQHRNSFISWASDFYGHNDMDIVRCSLPESRPVDLIFVFKISQLEVYVR